MTKGWCNIKHSKGLKAHFSHCNFAAISRFDRFSAGRPAGDR